MTAAGFDIKPGEHPIVPDHGVRRRKAQQLSARLLELGVYVVGFFFPVVPKGQARIRVQMSAAHERADLEQAVAAFTQAGRELGLPAEAAAEQLTPWLPASSSSAPTARSAPSWPRRWPQRHGAPGRHHQRPGPEGRVPACATRCSTATDAAR
jgi:hypothetical protein